jgi:glycosyltransferase involved in cell wall biosynthesis
MRILFVTNALGYGGIEQNIVRLTRALSEQGHQVLTASRGGPLVRSVERAGGRHLALEVRPRSPSSLRRDGARIRSLFEQPEPPEVIHNFGASTAVVLKAAFPARRPVPCAASIMGLAASPEEAGWWTWARCWVTTWGCDRLLVISPAIRSVVGRLPLSKRRVEEAPVVGVELTESEYRSRHRERMRKALGLEPDRPLIVTIGRLAPEKSHELFVRASAQARGRAALARWWIVGEGPLRAQIESLVEELGVGERVTLAGERSDVAQLLAAADVCVKPGIVEGFVGITVLEAQSVGTPVVAFATEDVEMAIQHGVSGLVVPHDPESLSAAVQSILENDQLAAKLATEGREAVRRFDIDTVARELLVRYERLLSGEGSPRR